MTDDFETTGSLGMGLLDTTNEAELVVIREDDYDHVDFSTILGPNVTESGLLEAPSSFLRIDPFFDGNCVTQGLYDADALGYEDYCAADPSALDCSPDSNDFGGYGFVTLDTPCAADKGLPQEVGRKGQEMEYKSWKRRKGSMLPEIRKRAGDVKVFDGDSVLKLFFKHSQNLTMKLLEDLAEDMGYSFEYVVGFYVRYRRAVKSSVGIQGCTPAADYSTSESVEQFYNGKILNLEVGKTVKDTLISDNLSNDIQYVEGEGKDLLQSAGHTGRDKSFQCAVSGCSMRFSRQGDLNRHSKKHRPGEFPCKYPKCSKVFYRKDKLRQHWDKEHRNSLQPSNLSSKMPRKDDTQDGGSGSNGLSGSNSGGQGGNSSDKTSESGGPDTPSSSNSGCQSEGHKRCSGGVPTESEMDVQDRTDKEVFRLTLQQTELAIPTTEGYHQALQTDLPVDRGQKSDLDEADSSTTYSKDRPMDSGKGYDSCTTLTYNPSISSSISKPTPSSSRPGYDLPKRLTEKSMPNRHMLPCLFINITGCSASFKLSEHLAWYLHHFSHYSVEGPPTHAKCIFCRDFFGLKADSIPWKECMRHIADHFEAGWTLEVSEPDYHCSVVGTQKYGCTSDKPPQNQKADTSRPDSWMSQRLQTWLMGEAENENQPLPSSSSNHGDKDTARTKLSTDVAATLERHFQEQQKPSSSTKRRLAEQAGLDICRVNNWFQNRRAKEKQKTKQAEFALREAAIPPPSEPLLRENGPPAVDSRGRSLSLRRDHSTETESCPLRSEGSTASNAARSSFQRTLVETEAAVASGGLDDKTPPKGPKRRDYRTEHLASTLHRGADSLAIF